MITFWILTFLVLSALFSGSEIAFVSANKLSIELKKKKGGRRGRMISTFYNKPAHFLGTMLIGNNIALVAFTTLMDGPLNGFFTGEFGFTEGTVALLLLNTLVVTIIVLISGEFLPKTFFQLYAADLLYFMAFPLRIAQFLFKGPTLLMIWLSNFILKHVFKSKLEEGEEVFTRHDLITFIKGTSDESEKEQVDRELFHNALRLESKRVKAVMIPRTEVQVIEVTRSIKELEACFVKTKHSRLLVIDEEIDEVLGYVHHQQLLHQPTSIKDIILPIPFAPEVMPVIDLMNQLIKKRVSIACIFDEYGGMSGIVTLEDIQEEFFGEIEDEHDEGEHTEMKMADDKFRFSGRLEIEYLNEKYGFNLPEGDYHTLSGYIVMTTEDIPTKGDRLPLGNFVFTFLEVSNTKIELVEMKRLKKE